MRTILLIDDEPMMLDLLSLYLSPFYNCIQKQGANEGIQFLHSHHVDLILLDIMMPEMDGWIACKKIREFSDIPIIMLTAMSEKHDIVRGLNVGADDFITKPFDEGELVARINAVLRRIPNSKKKLSFKGLLLDEESYQLKYDGIEIPLTPKEFGMMSLFLKNSYKVFSREHLISSLWGMEVSTEDRTIDSHVRNLREKLRKSGFPADKHLVTVWGVGYKWVGKEG